MMREIFENYHQIGCSFVLNLCDQRLQIGRSKLESIGSSPNCLLLFQGCTSSYHWGPGWICQNEPWVPKTLSGLGLISSDLALPQHNIIVVTCPTFVKLVIIILAHKMSSSRPGHLCKCAKFLTKKLAFRIYGTTSVLFIFHQWTCQIVCWRSSMFSFVAENRCQRWQSGDWNPI